MVLGTQTNNAKPYMKLRSVHSLILPLPQIVYDKSIALPALSLVWNHRYLHVASLYYKGPGNIISFVYPTYMVKFIDRLMKCNLDRQDIPECSRGQEGKLNENHHGEVCCMNIYMKGDLQPRFESYFIA